MFAKKKMGQVPEAQREGRQRIADSLVPSRKVYQQHSRRTTAERQNPRWDRFLIEKFHRSARQNTNRNLLEQMTNLQYGFSTSFTVAVHEACRISQAKEFLNNYYILSKNRDPKEGKVFIENTLVQVIQRRSLFQFQSRPLMHYGTHIFRIMKHHMMKRAAYIRKASSLRTMPCIGKENKAWIKELPALVNTKDREQAQPQDIKRGKQDHKKRMNTSQSFQLQNLAECIKEMFQKQGKRDNRKEEEWSQQRETGQSWLKGRYSNQRPLMECDFSSIEMNGQCDLMMDSRMRQKLDNHFEVEQNYGLGELKRRYEEQRLSKINQLAGSQVVNKGLGHKRNPTEALHTKEQQHYIHPMTPRESSSKSVFNSTKNIMMNSPSLKNKLKNPHSKSKDNEPYLLQKPDKRNQDKKQQPPKVPQILKQNLSKQPKGKLTKNDLKSKSKSKDKMWKLGMGKNDMKKLMS